MISLKKVFLIVFASAACANLAACGDGPQASTLMDQSARIQLSGRIRVYQSGADTGLQVDVQSAGAIPAFGPSVAVTLDGVGFVGDAKLYPYYGGNTSTAFTVFPRDQGYVMLKLPAGVAITSGQAVRVTLSAAGASNFESLSGRAVFCRKGVELGCD